ncbi:hypothetical protein BD560DRAFT_417864, partial [Blakeslea trispora]
VNVDCREHASQTRPAPKQLMFQKWNAHSEELMEWYIKSFDLMGEPNLSRVCANFGPLQCLCPDKRMSKLTLYFLNSVQKVNVEHCSCSPLTKQLISNQLMPASFQSPKRAIDFAMMDYFHLLKMNAYVSNHCFARISNQLYQKTGASSADESPLTKLIVNNVYFLYRRLLLFVQDNVNKKYDLGAVDQCLACEGADRKLVTLDGNFQMKHRKDASSETLHDNGILAPSALESSLWGSRNEVDAFENVKAGKDDCVLDQVEDSVFKANSNSNRNMSSSRYDANGVFSMSCA